MSTKDKWVRRFSVDETSKHKNGFTIYRITSVLFPIESPEAVTTVSVWKRYSDVQRLHKSMRSLHAGLHLRGAFPTLPRSSYFKRFQKEVIEERAKTIKALLEFVAEHRLLFTSTEFVNFLQTGYPEPETQSEGVINAIRSSLHLPIEETQPIEYQTDDDDTRTPTHSEHREQSQTYDSDVTDFISTIPIYEAADVELRKSPEKPELTGSFESINSLGSIDSDMYEELSKVTIDKRVPSVRRRVLPDLIMFDAPSTSTFDDYHTMRSDRSEPDTVSLNSQSYDAQSEYRRSVSRSSLHSKHSAPSLSNACCATRTDDTYVFEAGYLFSQAGRCEDLGDYRKAFDYYKSGIEKMLIGMKADPDDQRKALIKEKTNKYLSYAETLYKNHLCDAEPTLVDEQLELSPSRHCSLPLSMLRRAYSELGQYRVLGLLGTSMMLVMHRGEQACYAMKVIQKIPNNLTEFDEYFLQRTNETRQPILPTVIPYMVPLHAYVETTNLIFLILSYAPGEKLFDYIKKYTKTPNSPVREVNLENVFPEPNRSNWNTETRTNNSNSAEQTFSTANINNTNSEQKFSTTNIMNNSNSEQTFSTMNINNSNSEQKYSRTNMNNSNLEIVTSASVGNELARNDIANENLQNHLRLENNNVVVTERRNEVSELVLNSQKLLLNVDKVLCGGSNVSESEFNQDPKVEVKRNENKPVIKMGVELRESLPASALCKWGAEVLTAVESLHNSGVICRDLNPSNILLGEGGQVILTYMVQYPGIDSCLARLRAGPLSRRMCIAPELFHHPVDLASTENRVCDFWSFGAIMYELLCAVPLSHHHRAVFTSHTMLHLPDGLSIEEQSLLSQLLTYEPSERLGAGDDGIEEIKRHPYFKSIDWQYIYDSWVVPD